MKRKQPVIDESRRRLLGGALAAGTVGVVVGAAGVRFARGPRGAVAPTVAPASQGYHETEHIRDYYRSTE